MDKQYAALRRSGMIDTNRTTNELTFVKPGIIRRVLYSTFLCGILAGGNSTAYAQDITYNTLAQKLAGCYEIEVDSSGQAIDGHLSPSGLPQYVQLTMELTGWDDESEMPARYKLFGPDSESGRFSWDWDPVLWRWAWGITSSDSLFIGNVPDLGGYQLFLGTRDETLQGRVTVTTDYHKEDLPDTRTMPLTLKRVDCNSVPSR